MNQMPEVELYLIASAEQPTGVGEPDTLAIAPAVATTSQLLRQLPLRSIG